jgi:hypothetical protein
MDGTVLVMDYSGFEIKKIKYILSNIEISILLKFPMSTGFILLLTN